MVILFALLASSAAFLGGWLAFRFKDTFHLILGLAGGLLLGAAFFNLLPESIEVGGLADLEPATMLLLALVGFIAFYLVDTIFGLHPHQEDEGHHHPAQVGLAGASGMSIHSLLDGIGIGVAFQAGAEIGLLVAVAVVGHRFSDGLNIVTLLRRSNQSLRTQKGGMIVIALAPLLGAAISYLVSIPDALLASALAFFAGMFLYISTSDLLPEAHHAHATRWTIASTLAGVLIIFALTRLASI